MAEWSAERVYLGPGTVEWEPVLWQEGDSLRLATLPMDFPTEKECVAFIVTELLNSRYLR